MTSPTHSTPPRTTALTAPIAIAGPTASGKTASALALAAALAPTLAVEIISVDSALVYQSMDIGTAKPSPAELAQVPHHLINIRDPLQAYSAADFVRDAQALMASIQARGALPLLVGGTMLYFKALQDGIDDMPPANPEVRAQLEAQAARLGWAAMHEQLSQVDPITAARLAPGDSQRIQRALEVWHLTQRPISAFHTPTKATTNAATNAASMPLLSLEPTDRHWLHQRIEQRFDAMLAQGLVDEVQRLRARGDLHADLPSMRCVGYRQTWQALDDAGIAPSVRHPQLTPAALAHVRERGIIATRQLAKRQMTWMRSMPHRQVIACDSTQATDQLVQQALAHVRQRC